MAQFVGFGSGSDGVVTLSGTDALVDSSCSGTSGTRTLTIGSGLSFATGDMVLIHQSRGTGAGNWEVAIVESYSGTTLTLTTNLVNTYTDSGASQAQVLEMKQYSQVTISGTLTAKEWDGNVGGIIAFACNGKVTISGTVTTGGPGPNGGYATTPGGFRSVESASYTGEGDIGDSTTGTPANGSGGGGATGGTDSNRSGGAGGGNGTAGGNGTGSGGSGGTGGSIAGAANLSTMVFGGGGGTSSGSVSSSGGPGGQGGGIIVIFAKILEVTGTIKADGSDGQVGGTAVGPGGGGAGGSILIKGDNVILGTNLLLARGGSGATGGGGTGGAGGNGRIAIEACSRTGTTNPAATETIGGRPWCSSVAGII